MVIERELNSLRVAIGRYLKTPEKLERAILRDALRRVLKFVD